MTWSRVCALWFGLSGLALCGVAPAGSGRWSHIDFVEYYAFKGEVLEHANLVPDEMVRTFVLCGEPDRVREQVERAWGFADSLCLVPPAYALPPEKLAGYGAETAKLFYTG